MDEERFEEVRSIFFKRTNIDLKNLESDEVRGLLWLLPEVLTALYTEYDMPTIYGFTALQGQAELALSYIEDGAPATAAERLRAALDNSPEF